MLIGCMLLQSMYRYRHTQALAATKTLCDAGLPVRALSPARVQIRKNHIRMAALYGAPPVRALGAGAARAMPWTLAASAGRTNSSQGRSSGDADLHLRRLWHRQAPWRLLAERPRQQAPGPPVQSLPAHTVRGKTNQEAPGGHPARLMPRRYESVGRDF